MQFGHNSSELYWGRHGFRNSVETATAPPICHDGMVWSQSPNTIRAPTQVTASGTLNPLKPSGHYMYHQAFNIQKFYVLPTNCIYVFCVDLRTNSDYFPIQQWLTGFYNRDGLCLLRGTSCILHCTAQFSSCPRAMYIFQCPPPRGCHAAGAVIGARIKGTLCELRVYFRLESFKAVLYLLTTDSKL